MANLYLTEQNSILRKTGDRTCGLFPYFFLNCRRFGTLRVQWDADELVRERRQAVRPIMGTACKYPCGGRCVDK